MIHRLKPEKRLLQVIYLNFGRYGRQLTSRSIYFLFSKRSTFTDFGCDFESVRRLLDPHCSSFFTLIFIACMLQQFIVEPSTRCSRRWPHGGAGTDVNARPSTIYGRTTLQDAAQVGHMAVVEQLQAGADVNACTH